MRLIDADKLLAQYKERCAGCKETKNYCEHCCDIADVISDIEDAPTADAVEVVRCKDCKWNGDDCTWCSKPSLVLNGDYISCLCIEPGWFCADGERKEKTDER